MATMEMTPDPKDQLPAGAGPASLVTQIRLRPGMMAEFSSWHAKMCTAAAEAAGFISAEVNASASGPAEWSVAQHFRSAADLEVWRASEQHRSLLDEAHTLADEND